MDSNWCNHRKYLIFDYSFLSDLKGDLFEDIDLYDFKEISCYIAVKHNKKGCNKPATSFPSKNIALKKVFLC